MSQEDLADAIGKNQRTLSAYESGRVAIPLHLIPLIETICKVSSGTIFHKAGLVALDVEAAIRSDPDLRTEKKRETVATYYRFVRDEVDEGSLGQ